MDDGYVRDLIFAEEVLKPSELELRKFRGYDVRRLEYIRKVLEKRGREWVIAAIIDGSIGYHTYASAENLLESVLENRFWISERTCACFHGDASLEVASDIWMFEHLTATNPEKVERIVEFVKKLKGLSWEKATTISMMYPTLNI